MSHYKLIFVNNLPISCTEIKGNPDIKEPYKIEYAEGKLIHAIVKSNSKDEAFHVVNQLIKDVSRATGGGDFLG
jgi:hypothetical protein